jgi:hypothetical protein
MPSLDDRPPVDAILQKVMEAVPFQLSVDGGIDEARRRLRDDGARYAELLTEAGVTVELHNAETLVHGYLGYTGVVPAATEATQRGLAALRAALHG